MHDVTTPGTEMVGVVGESKLLLSGIVVVVVMAAVGVVGENNCCFFGVLVVVIVGIIINENMQETISKK